MSGWPETFTPNKPFQYQLACHDAFNLRVLLIPNCSTAALTCENRTVSVTIRPPHAISVPSTNGPAGLPGYSSQARRTWQGQDMGEVNRKWCAVFYSCLGHREGAYNPCPKWARIYRLMTESGSKAFPASRAPEV